MNFKHNATKFYLLANKPVIFTGEEEIQFELKLPTVESLYSNDDLSFCINFFQQDLEEIQKMINTPIKSYYSFVHLICSLRTTNPTFETLSSSILEGLSSMIDGIIFDKVLKIKNIIVNEKLFNEIIRVILLSIDKEKIIINDDDDEFTKKEKQAKLRVAKIRRNAQNKEGTSFEDLFAAILYEFPQYKIEDLMQMNLYTIYYLFKYVGKIANYEVSKIAAGNGLAKKHKYFIEK